MVEEGPGTGVSLEPGRATRHVHAGRELHQRWTTAWRTGLWVPGPNGQLLTAATGAGNPKVGGISQVLCKRNRLHTSPQMIK